MMNGIQILLSVNFIHQVIEKIKRVKKIELFPFSRFFAQGYLTSSGQPPLHSFKGLLTNTVSLPPPFGFLYPSLLEYSIFHPGSPQMEFRQED